MKLLTLVFTVLCFAPNAGANEVDASYATEPASQTVKTQLIRGSQAPRVLSVDLTGGQDLYLAVTCGPDGYKSDQAIWAEPRLIDRAGRVVGLTSLKPQSQRVGWGRLFINESQRGGSLQIKDKVFAKGFWAHGPSLLHFKLNGNYTRFEALVGIDAGAGRNGSVQFQVSRSEPMVPTRDHYTKTKPLVPLKDLKAAPAERSPHRFDPAAAQILLDQGVERLVFIRRFTLNANHVYTEYVNSRWTPGGGLAVLDLRTGLARDLVPELSRGVVNRFDLSYDAQTIVFDYKAAADQGYRIYEVGVAGQGLRQLTFPTPNEAELVRKYGSRSYHHGTDDMHPCYLPDGGIVFVTTRCQYGILCNAADVYTTKNLYRMDGDGQNLQVLSNSPVSEASPAMLPDGRILYHRWEYVDKAAGNLKCLWAMNPDGTASSEIYGNTITFPETMIYPRPIPGAPGKIVMLGTSHCCPNNAMGAVIVIDTDHELRSVDTMQFVTKDIHALAHTGFHFRDAQGEFQYDDTGKLGRLFKDPYPLSEDLFLAARKPKGPAWDDVKAYDLSLLDGNGDARLLYQDKAISCWHPYPLRTREKPPVLASVPKPQLADQGAALCVVTDVYAGMEGVERGTIKYLRVLEQVPRPWAVRKLWFRDDKDGMAHSAIGHGFLGLKAQYGIVPVEPDGSAHFRVPALRNIYLQALDENYLAVQTERTYVHYMPGETRSCIGCHETPSRVSPESARAALALQRAPSVPTPQRGERSATKLFDYDRQIQPILDRHCLACHNAEKAEGGLNLCGDPNGVYSVSYHNLIALSKGSKELLGHRKPRNENVGSAGIEYEPPYSLGALSSPLAALLSQGRIKMRNAQRQAYADKLLRTHPDLRLSESDLLIVTSWLDLNCPFHPSYWGRLHAKFKDHPNYRPAVTFEEALMRVVPESISRAEAKAAHGLNAPTGKLSALTPKTR